MKTILIICIAILLGMTNALYAEFPAVEVYEDTSKNVVLIVARDEGSPGSLGAGSIVSQSGYIITNAHVVVNSATSTPFSKIRVYLKPERVTGKIRKDLVHRHVATVLSFNAELDLAILKVTDLPSDVSIIELANPKDIKIGEEVVTIGHPEQGGLWTLSYGRISGAIDNQNSIRGKDVYQTDASVNRGNSGGPLLDRRGYMVGINTNIARVGEGNMPITGVNFAVKSAVVKKWFDQQELIIDYGEKPLHNKKSVGSSSEKAEPSTKEEKESTEMHIPDTSDDQTMQKAEKPEQAPEQRILTPKKPFSYDDLFKEVEAEMEDMMDEMRGRIRK